MPATGPRVKLIRRLGMPLPGLTRKEPKEPPRPARVAHRRTSPFRARLIETQKCVLRALTREETVRVTPEMTIEQTIARYPGTIHIFQLHHIVVCCSPARSIHDAAARFEADEAALLRMLNAAALQASPVEAPAASLPGVP